MGRRRGSGGGEKELERGGMGKGDKERDGKREGGPREVDEEQL